MCQPNQIQDLQHAHVTPLHHPSSRAPRPSSRRLDGQGGTPGKKRPSKASTAALDQAPKKRCKPSSEESEGTETDDSEKPRSGSTLHDRPWWRCVKCEALKKELAVAKKVGAAETAAAKKEGALAVAEARKAAVVSKKEGSAALSAASLKGAAQFGGQEDPVAPPMAAPRVPLQTLTNSTAWLCATILRRFMQSPH
jgi:hypothetical protein